MPKHYVTFGQVHRHRLQGKILDKDTIAVFEAPSAAAGRKKAFELFGDRFCMEYHGKEWKYNDIRLFPRGLTELENV